MVIKEIAFTCYPVTDLARARQFYEKVLGLKPSSVWSDGKTGMIEYDLGNGTFAIGAGAENFTPAKEGASIAFEVDDFEGTIANLKKEGVNFIVEPMETPVCHMAIITDPDGTKLMIHHRKSQ